MSRLRRIGVAIKCEDYTRRMTPVQNVLSSGTSHLDGEPRQTAPARHAIEDTAVGPSRESDLEGDVVR